MRGEKTENLPDDLRWAAEYFFPWKDTSSCHCDTSVGHQCENCFLNSLLQSAAREIEKLRGKGKMIDEIKDMGGDPLAENKFMGVSMQQLNKQELLGVIDILIKERKNSRERTKTLCEFLGHH